MGFKVSLCKSSRPAEACKAYDSLWLSNQLVAISLLQPGANSISETGQSPNYFTSVKTSTKARQSSAYGVSKYKTSMSLWSQNLASAMVAISRAQGNTWDKRHPLLPSVGTPSFDSLVYFRFLRLHSGHICNRKKLRSKEAARLETREQEGDRTRAPKSHCFLSGK